MNSKRKSKNIWNCFIILFFTFFFFIIFKDKSLPFCMPNQQLHPTLRYFFHRFFWENDKQIYFPHLNCQTLFYGSFGCLFLLSFSRNCTCSFMSSLSYFISKNFLKNFVSALFHYFLKLISKDHILLLSCFPAKQNSTFFCICFWEAS